MTLDELLLEWSYRSEKGYPSLDNPSDIQILKTLLEKLNLPSDTIIEKLEKDDIDVGEKTYADKDGIVGTTGMEAPDYIPKHKKQTTRRI